MLPLIVAAAALAAEPLFPVMLVGGLSGSMLEARIEDRQPPIFGCKTQQQELPRAPKTRLRAAQSSPGSHLRSRPRAAKSAPGETRREDKAERGKGRQEKTRADGR